MRKVSSTTSGRARHLRHCAPSQDEPHDWVSLLVDGQLVQAPWLATHAESTWSVCQEPSCPMGCVLVRRRWWPIRWDRFNLQGLTSQLAVERPDYVKKPFLLAICL